MENNFVHCHSLTKKKEKEKNKEVNENGINVKRMKIKTQIYRKVHLVNHSFGCFEDYSDHLLVQILCYQNQPKHKVNIDDEKRMKEVKIYKIEERSREN